MALIRETEVNDVLVIKKVAQINGHHPKLRFLTNHSSHPGCSYGMVKNPNDILSVGTELKVIGKGKAQTKYRQSYVTVKHMQQEFDIFASDMRRFCK
tara:strand:- start:180 stop:470 length:291 start_codon:yes stop_codon:yes gene_type:complete